MIGGTHYDHPNPKDHNYGDMPTDYPEIMPGDVDAYGNRYNWVRSNTFVAAAAHRAVVGRVGCPELATEARTLPGDLRVCAVRRRPTRRV